MRRLDDHWATAKRYGHAFACGVIDVDRFKLLNDRFGHAAGDCVLQHIAINVASRVCVRRTMPSGSVAMNLWCFFHAPRTRTPRSLQHAFSKQYR